MRRLQGRNIERRRHGGDLGLAEDPQKLGSRLARRVERFARAAEPRRSAADPRRRWAGRCGQRALIVHAGPAWRSQRSRPPRRCWNLRDRAFELGCRSGIPELGQRGLERARCSGTPSRLSHCQTGSSEVRRIWPGRTAACPRPETAPAGGTAVAPGRRCAAALVVPRCRARSCAADRARGGDRRIFAALDRALELPHQQRLRFGGSCAR